MQTTHTPTITAAAIEHGQDYAGQDLSGWHATEKKDGVRAYWDGATLYSRSAKPCPVPDWMRAALPDGVALDCELYAGPGDAGRQAAAVAIQRGRIAPGMVLYVHDMPQAPGDYAQRMRAAHLLLSDATSHSDQGAPVQVLTVTTAISTAHAVQLMRAVVTLGGEGLMLRAPGHTYRAGRHVFGHGAKLVKLKPDPDGTMGHGIT